jgi:hypothetical protein
MTEAEKISIIISQTDYTEDQAREYLLRYDNDEISVIRYYLTGSEYPTAKHEAIARSKNQLVYSEIRKFMDACSKNPKDATGHY